MVKRQPGSAGAGSQARDLGRGISGAGSRARDLRRGGGGAGARGNSGAGLVSGPSDDRQRPRASSAAPGDNLHAGQGRAVGVEETLVPGHALGGGLQSRDRGAREDALREVAGQREASLAPREERAAAREHRDAPRAALARGVTHGHGNVQRVGEDLLGDARGLEEAAMGEERVEAHPLLAQDVPMRTAAKTLMSWARTAFARVTRA